MPTPAPQASSGPVDPPSLKEKVRHLPDGPGVYLMKDRLGRILYVGKAKILKRRVSSYFQPSRNFTQQPKIRALVDLIADFDIIEVRSEPEALLLEGRLIKQYKPRYNTDFTDDKRFLLVRVTVEAEMPRFVLTRLRKDERSRYFGPFAFSTLVRKTLTEMRRQFGVLLGDAHPVQIAEGVYRLYDDVRAELYGHANEVSVADYRRRIEAACEFLEGKSREWLGTLRASASRRGATSSVRGSDGARSKRRVLASVSSSAATMSRNFAARSNSCRAAAACISARSVSNHSRLLPSRNSHAASTRRR